LKKSQNFIKENLSIIVSSTSRMNAGNSVYVELKFEGEPWSFSQAHIYIPDNKD
jgi:hypothetical protein